MLFIINNTLTRLISHLKLNWGKKVGPRNFFRRRNWAALSICFPRPWIGFGPIRLAGHISWLMNEVSQHTVAWPCHDRHVSVHCLAGRQTRIQQCCKSLAALATLLDNAARWFWRQIQWPWGWYIKVSTPQQRPYGLAERGIHPLKTAGINVALFDRHLCV